MFPKFNPDEAGANAKEWCEKVDIYLSGYQLQGSALQATLKKNLKGSALSWLRKVPFDGMTWPEFRYNFLLRFEDKQQHTMAETLISINSQRPSEDESYAAYANRLITSLIPKLAHLTPEEIAVSVALSHICQIDSSVERLAHTTEKMTRQFLLKELQGLKYKPPQNPTQTLTNGEAHTRDNAMPSTAAHMGSEICNRCFEEGHVSTTCPLKSFNTPEQGPSSAKPTDHLMETNSSVIPSVSNDTLHTGKGNDVHMADANNGSPNTENHTTAGTSNEIDQLDEETSSAVYAELVRMERRALLPNTEEIECEICMDNCQPGQGAVLRDCIHAFCKECLADVVKHSQEATISCPALNCSGVLSEREVRGLVSPEEFDKWLARGLATAESGSQNSFHCRTRDCRGWAISGPGITTFPCRMCCVVNCIPCQAVHEGDTCEEFRAKQKSDKKTRGYMHNLIARGEAMECPECKAFIAKDEGCDWILCSGCRTELCWATRGRRWGPRGHGDTSGGCQCGGPLNKCHPSCDNCH